MKILLQILLLVALGVDHEKLVKYVKPPVFDIPSVTRPKAPSVYVGGERNKIH